MNNAFASVRLLAAALAGLAVMAEMAIAGPPAASTSAPAVGQVIDRWQWAPPWARQAGAAKSATDEQVRHDGRASIRIEYGGPDDWSLNPQTYGDGQRARLSV